ncbi:MAG TPA: NAD(+)/NADH kinase [Blastocatellia bacterium]|nr:NAD(+)/NADH kinase [Blastocatellia bacterium]
MLKISSCVVVVKQTALAQGGRAAQFAGQGDATAHRLIHADKEHHHTLTVVQSVLAKRQIGFEAFPIHRLTARAKRKLTTADLVITVGGDGTALTASHYIRHGVMLGVNSAPGDSIGHFCHSTRDNFAHKLDDILNARWQASKLTRLQVTLDDQLLPELALNDVLITHECPAATTRYIMTVDGYEEEQRSSGVWISTAAGSTAGICSAGGRVMPLLSRRIQYLVREPYREHGRDYQVRRGFVDPGESILIASKMQQGWLYIDGARTAYRFPFGARALLSAAPFDLKIFLSRAAQT